MEGRRHDGTLRIGVIGVGYLGQFHAEKYAQMDGVHCVAVVDHHWERAQTIATKIGAKAFPRPEAIYSLVDAVSIVVPTSYHYDVAKGFLVRGIDVLVEKPIAANLQQATTLIRLARIHGCILQVGHLERFNSVWRAIGEVIENPRFIEAHRLGPFQERGTDVDVILDLMIHDIDIVLKFTRMPIRAIDSVGVPVLSTAIDIANARIHFVNGSVANLTASRVTTKRTRKIRFFQQDLYASVDYDSREIQVYQRSLNKEGIPEIVGRHEVVPAHDALREELDCFIDSVRTRRPPEVDGEVGKQALNVALRILRKIRTA
jgi:predicted dehydrogenase